MPVFSMDDFRAEREKLRGLKSKAAKKIARGREGGRRESWAGRRESWAAFVERTVESARARIADLEHRPGQIVDTHRGPIETSVLVEYYRGIIAELENG